MAYARRDGGSDPTFLKYGPRALPENGLKIFKRAFPTFASFRRAWSDTTSSEFHPRSPTTRVLGTTSALKSSIQTNIVPELKLVWHKATSRLKLANQRRKMRLNERILVPI